MSDTLHFPDELPRDLPPNLQQAVRRALAAHCLCPPPRYDPTYWREEREAIANYAVWQAAQAYRAEIGISREAFATLCAKRAIDAEWRRLWERDKAVVAMPVDAETGEEVEFADEEALERIEASVLCAQVREALERLSAEERQLLAWYFGEGVSEREIAAQLNRSHVAVHKRLRRAWKHLCELLGVEQSFPGREPSAKGQNRRRKRADRVNKSARLHYYSGGGNGDGEPNGYHERPNRSQAALVAGTAHRCRLGVAADDWLCRAQSGRCMPLAGRSDL